MKTTFDNSSLVREWLKQCQPEGRNRGGSMSFSDGCLYSYQAVIARIVTNSKGERAVVKNGARFSHATDMHQREITSAPGYSFLYTLDDRRRTDLSEASKPKAIMEHCLGEAARLQIKSVGCHVTGKWYLDHAARWNKRAEDAAQFFGVELPSLDSFLEDRKREVEECKQKRKERAEADEDCVKQWINGELKFHNALSRRPARLRLAFRMVKENPEALGGTFTESCCETVVQCSHIVSGDGYIGTLNELLPALLDAANGVDEFADNEGHKKWNGTYRGRITVRKTEVRRLLASAGYNLKEELQNV